MQNINEELNRMLYLTQHKRGIVISEQNSRGNVIPKSRQYVDNDTPDWEGKSNGVLRFDTKNNILATNISYHETNNNPSGLFTANIKSSPSKELPIHKSLPDDGGQPIPGTPGGDMKFEFKGSTFPYPDNIVTPMFNMPIYKQAKAYFDDAVDRIVQEINNSGLDAIKQINIKGSADSAKPTFLADLNYVSFTGDNVLDHNYGGEKKDLVKMNQYLADERANRMKNELVSEISAKTKTDISNKINVIIPGDNWYDPNFEGRKTSTPDVKTKRYGIKSVIIDVIGGNHSEPGTKDDYIKTNTVTTYDNLPFEDTGTLDLSGQGGPKSIPYREIIASNGSKEYGIKDNEENNSLLGNILPDRTEVNSINGKNKVNCSISDNGTVTIDGKVWGNLIEDSEVGNESLKGFITEKPMVVAYKKMDGYIYFRNANFVLNKTY